MSQDYSNFNTNLEGLTNYIEANGVKLTSAEKKTLSSIFNTVSKNNSKLDATGVTSFIDLIKSGFSKVADLVLEFFASITGQKPNADNNIKSLMQKELDKRKIKLSAKDKEYWANLINKTSNKYHVAPELLITIISKECGFEKHLTESTGAGPMGMTTAAIEAFTPKDSKGRKNDWYNIFNKMHPELLKDILKYSQSPKQLRQMAGKNDELGILMGILTYEIKYCSEAAKKLYGKANYGTIPKAIDKIVNGGYRLDDAASIKNSLRNYNGSYLKDTYAKVTMDTLSNTLSYKHYKDLIFRTPKQ